MQALACQTVLSDFVCNFLFRIIYSAKRRYHRLSWAYRSKSLVDISLTVSVWHFECSVPFRTGACRQWKLFDMALGIRSLLMAALAQHHPADTQMFVFACKRQRFRIVWSYVFVEWAWKQVCCKAAHWRSRDYWIRISCFAITYNTMQPCIRCMYTFAQHAQTAHACMHSIVSTGLLAVDIDADTCT